MYLDKVLKKCREEKLWGFKAVKCHWCVSMFPNKLFSPPPPTFKGAELGDLLFKPYPSQSEFCGIAALLCKPELPEEACLPLPVSIQVRDLVLLSCNGQVVADSFCALFVAVKRTGPLSSRFEL